MPSDRILEEYQRYCERLFGQLAEQQRRLTSLLSARGIQIHLISGRVKSEGSLRRKLGRPDRTYESLWSVTDLVGLRITTYFEDAIEEVARAIEESYRVDFGHSADKLRAKDSGRFGYRSLHYVCSLPAPARQPSDEPGLPPAFRFEIQIRTVLQHAWAEVEHDLGYKAQDVVPEDIRRRFSRIAGLLEIADQEFVSIRRELARYERAVAAELEDPDRPVPLDSISLQTVARSREVRELDEAVAGLLGKPLSADVFFPDYLVRMLRLSGLVNTRDLHASLRANRAHVLAMIPPYFEFARSTWKLTVASLDQVHLGYSLFFLSLVAILRGPDLGISKVSKLTQVYRELDYPDDERTAHRVASGLVAALQG